jgi:small-conductance mechanosensitive channel
MRAMPDIAFVHPYASYIHIVGVFLFLLAHGVSAAVVWRLRSERDPAAVRTLVDFSARSIGVMGIGAAMWFFSGIILGFSGNYWSTGRYWLWASLAVAVVVVGLMTPMGRLYLNRVREALGIDSRGPVDQPISTTVDPAALDAAIMSGRPLLLIAIGFGGILILTWLMMFKPF